MSSSARLRCSRRSPASSGAPSGAKARATPRLTAAFWAPIRFREDRSARGLAADELDTVVDFLDAGDCSGNALGGIDGIARPHQAAQVDHAVIGRDGHLTEI